MSTEFNPIVPFEESPERISELENAEKPQRVDIREPPLGTEIEFLGIHADSGYICLLTGSESDRQIKIWHKGRGNGSISSIDNLVSINPDDFSQVESGILQIGRNYLLPHFYCGPNNDLI